MSAGVGLLSAALGGLKGYGEGVTKSYEAQEEEKRQARRDAVLMRQQKALAELGITSQEKQSAAALALQEEKFRNDQLNEGSRQFIDGVELTNKEVGAMPPDQQSTANWQTPGQAAEHNAKRAADAKAADAKTKFGYDSKLKEIEFGGRKSENSEKAKQQLKQKAVITATEILTDPTKKYGFLESNPSMKGKPIEVQTKAIVDSIMAAGGFGPAEGSKASGAETQLKVIKSPGKEDLYLDPATGKIIDKTGKVVTQAKKGPGAKTEGKKRKRTPEMQAALNQIVKDATTKLTDWEKHQAKKKLKAEKKAAGSKRADELSNQPIKTPPNYPAFTVTE